MSDVWTPASQPLVIWLLGPYIAAFTVALLPALNLPLILPCVLTTGLLGAWLLLGGPGLQLLLLVCLAVWIEGRRQGWTRSGWLLLLVLLGALNTSFLTTDLVSLYVSLEVVAISAFLLILRGATANAGWIALRYLLVSNTAMGLYLIGATLVYSQSGSLSCCSHRPWPVRCPVTPPSSS